MFQFSTDLICAQGGEGGGHTGNIATTILIPMVVDLCKYVIILYFVIVCAMIVYIFPSCELISLALSASTLL